MGKAGSWVKALARLQRAESLAGCCRELSCSPSSRCSPRLQVPIPSFLLTQIECSSDFITCSMTSVLTGATGKAPYRTAPCPGELSNANRDTDRVRLLYGAASDVLHFLLELSEPKLPTSLRIVSVQLKVSELLSHFPVPCSKNQASQAPAVLICVFYFPTAVCIYFIHYFF